MSAAPATAGPGSAAIRQKGWTKLINPKSSILLGRAEVSGVDHKFRERPAETVVNALGKLEAMEGAEQVEFSRIVPLAHDAEPIEQWNLSLLRHQAHTIQIGRHRNHRLGARTVLWIHQNHVDPRFLQRSNALVDRAAKILGINGANSINRAGLPDDQSRPFCLHQLSEAAGSFFS